MTFQKGEPIKNSYFLQSLRHVQISIFKIREEFTVIRMIVFTDFTENISSLDGHKQNAFMTVGFDSRMNS